MISKFELYTNLCLTLKNNGLTKMFEKLSAEILKEYDNLDDYDVKRAALFQMGPLVFEYERNLLYEKLELFPYIFKDKILKNVVKYVLSQRIPADPVDLTQMNVKVDFKNALRTCEIINHMSGDNAIFSTISILVDSIIYKQNGKYKCDLMEKQAVKIAKKMNLIIIGKLPDSRNIKHEGYQIIAYSCLAKLLEAVLSIKPYRAEKVWLEIGVPKWEELRERAKKIPNKADKGFVLAIIGENCVHDLAIAKNILDEANSITMTINNRLDRIARFTTIAKSYKAISYNEAARHVIEQMLPLLKGIKHEDNSDEVIKLILETAHSIDPAFGSVVANKIDNPMTQLYAKKELKSLKYRSDPTSVDENDKDLVFFIESFTNKIYKSVCSGRTQIQMDEIPGKWVNLSFGKGFKATNSSVQWFLENALLRNTGVKASQYFDLYIKILGLNNMLTKVVYTVNEPAAIKEKNNFIEKVAPRSSITIIGEGNKDQAIDLISDWMLNESKNYIKILDPYFNVEDLYILKFIPSGMRVHIITSIKGQNDGNLSKNPEKIEKVYKKKWKELFDHSPNNIIINVMGIPGSGDSPMHDRYYVSESSGLLLGVSLNGYNTNISSIQHLDEDEKNKVEVEEIDIMISNPPFKYKNKELIIKMFTL